MKSRKLTWFAAMTLFAAVALPVRLAAQVGGTGSTNFIPIWTNSTTLGNSILFQTGGKVGIGTTSPAARLHVVGQNGSAPQDAPWALQVSGGRGGNSANGSRFSGAGGALQLNSGSGGSIGSQFTVHAFGGTGAAILITGGTGGSCAGTTGCSTVGGNGGSIMLQPGAGGSATSRAGRPGNVILAPTGGRVGIRTTNPGATLDIGVGGTTLADAWITRSSRRFKANIQPLEGALEKVQRLQGISFPR
jgi:hypothetical protein